MDFSRPPTPALLLVDNGSLQPAATRTLRRIAGELATTIGRPVAPVSLLHSDKVPETELDGIAAETLENAIRFRRATGTTHFQVVPLFFGASGALTDYVPRRVAALSLELTGLRVDVAAPVAGSDLSAPDRRVARILADQVRTTMRRLRLQAPVVVLVDHGSPQRAVTALRNCVAEQLAEELGTDARAVVASSMERREGPEYEFNEPLLERALDESPCGAGAGDVVLAPLFFSAGRHAGPGGDVETIAQAAVARHRELRVHFAPLFGEHPLLIEILADRSRTLLAQG